MDYAGGLPAPGLALRARSLLTTAVDRLLLWRERARQRRVLASLDGRMLRDIGLSGGMARQESAKPFWRD
jgi:uncharacterized protein YjiS (DUF1127 family)